MNPLEEKLIRWYQEPAVQAHNWEPRLFWKEIDPCHPFGTLKVEPRELEVLFATLIGESSECMAELNAESQVRGDYMLRGDFLAANARRHELPLLTRVYA
ncbi:MAG: hypothetical protein V4563_09430 [Pseudomonadota bacterium]